MTPVLHGMEQATEAEVGAPHHHGGDQQVAHVRVRQGAVRVRPAQAGGREEGGTAIRLTAR